MIKESRIWTLRRILWFEKGEVREIAAKFAALKWNNTFCESTVLGSLALGTFYAFFASWVYGLLCLWAFKQAIQALNVKRFFD